MYNTHDMQTYNYYTPYGNFFILLMLILVGKTTVIFRFSSFKLNFTVSSLKKGCCKTALYIPLNLVQTQPSRPAIFTQVRNSLERKLAKTELSSSHGHW